MNIVLIAAVALTSGLFSVFALLSIAFCDNRVGRWLVGVSLSSGAIFLTLSSVTIAYLF